MTSPRTLSIAALIAASALLPTTTIAQTREGVRVRGHWVIEVRNPDGTLITRREFDNSLAPGGAGKLAEYLGGFVTPARWTVELGVYGGATSPCHGGTFNGNPLNHCFIVDSAASPMPTGTSIFPTLSTTNGPSSFEQVVMTGNVTARVAGQIVYVATRQSGCLNFVAPADCNLAGVGIQFTVHDLTNGQGQPAPLSIAAGQIVQVTVTLSFS